MSTETTAEQTETQEAPVAVVSATETTEAPPEVAGEKPQDPDVIGSLTPDEIGTLTMLRQRSAQIVSQIGDVEVRKARMLGTLSEIEDQAQQVVQRVGKRLGLPDNTPFQMLPDGRVRKVPNPTA